MATRHSNRRPQSRAGGKRSQTTPATPVPPKQLKQSAARAEPKKKKRAERPDFHAILGCYSDALALVETAYTALEVAQEDDECSSAPAVLTLDHGIRALRRVYTELDLAILGKS